MRITFVLPFASLAGGVRVVATYARHLSDQGHEVWVVSSIRQRRKWTWSAILTGRFLKGRNKGKFTQTPLLEFLGDRHVILEGKRSPTSADLPDADAVIATWWTTAEAVAELPAEKGRKFYFLQDYEVYARNAASHVARTYALPLRKFAVSSYIRESLARNHGVDPSDVDVILNAVDTTQFDAPPRGRQPRITVGFLAQTHPRKRTELAVASVVEARRRLPDLRVLSFGTRSREDYPGFPDWIEHHQLPPQDMIPQIYASCDAWLFTSEAEGFGLPILEAMACRTPVLGTRAGAAPDLIDGLNGRMVAPSAEAFADEILRISRMLEAEWVGMSDAAYATARLHGWDSATAQLVELLSRKDGQTKDIDRASDVADWKKARPITE
jgi:glycosyltransferase involved in cell wall biosynthesis